MSSSLPRSIRALCARGDAILRPGHQYCSVIALRCEQRHVLYAPGLYTGYAGGEMPIQYDRDDLRELAVITIRGAFDPSEVLQTLEQHRAEGGWAYGLLYDLRLMTGEPSLELLREFAKVVARRPGESPRGPVAVLTVDPVMYARACGYAAMSRSAQTVEVFRDRDQAEAWLHEHVRS